MNPGRAIGRRGLARETERRGGAGKETAKELPDAAVAEERLAREVGLRHQSGESKKDYRRGKKKEKRDD